MEFSLSTMAQIAVIVASVTVVVVSLILPFKPGFDPIKIAAIIVPLLGLIATVMMVTEKRNADLVRIGISVLRVDPQKEKDVSEATRKWALDLIDANAGVKFSPEARAQLLKEPLRSWNLEPYDNTWSSSDFEPLRPLNAPEGPRNSPSNTLWSVAIAVAW